MFHRAADLLYHQLPSYVDKPILQQLLRNKQELERAVDEAFHLEIPHLPASGLYIIQREVIVQYLRQLIALDLRQAPFRILGLETDVYRSFTPISPQTSDILPTHSPSRTGGELHQTSSIIHLPSQECQDF